VFVEFELIALHVGNPEESGDGQCLDGQRGRTQHDRMPAFLVRLHDVVHVRVEACGNTFHKESLAQFVEIGDGLTTQITRRPHDEVLKFQPTESIPQRGLEHSEELADPGLPAPDAIPDVRRRREALDQRAVEVEERTDSWSG